MLTLIEKIFGKPKPEEGEPCEVEYCDSCEGEECEEIVERVTNYVVVLPHSSYGMAVAGPEEDVWAERVSEEDGYLRFFNDGNLVCVFAPGSWRNFFIPDDEGTDFSMLRRKQKEALRAIERENAHG